MQSKRVVLKNSSEQTDDNCLGKIFPSTIVEGKDHMLIMRSSKQIILTSFEKNFAHSRTFIFKQAVFV